MWSLSKCSKTYRWRHFTCACVNCIIYISYWYNFQKSCNGNFNEVGSAIEDKIHRFSGESLVYATNYMRERKA